MFNRGIEYIIKHPTQFSAPLTKAARELLIRTSYLTHRFRPLPEFAIVGAQKSGTTSLYKYLVQHPQILPAYKKEIHFFDRPTRYQRGAGWYRAHFPLRSQTTTSYITGEATPSYLAHPLAPQRMAHLIPDIKLIILLRDPVSRAYSHYQHVQRQGLESRPFLTAITEEQTEFPKMEARLETDPRFDPPEFWRHSYLTRGHYAHQLRRWQAAFPRDQIRLYTSNAFFADPAATLTDLCRFLELDHWSPPPETFVKFNSGSYEGIPAAIVEQLQTYYKPHNEHLLSEWGISFATALR